MHKEYLPTVTGAGSANELNMISVLSKFIPIPTLEESLRLCSISVKSPSDSAIVTMLSASRRCEMYLPFILMPRPLQSCVSKTSCRALVNSFGEITSSCLTPCSNGIGLV